MKRHLTLHDLARAAKVSPATVSRVVAGNPTVDRELRAHVHRTARKLGMDLEERRKGRTRIIAFLLANRDVLHSFQARLLVGAETWCARHNWEMLFMSFRYGPEVPAAALHLPQLLGDKTNARAVILGGSNHPNLLQALHARGRPFVTLGNNVIGEWDRGVCDVVYSDDVTGAADATYHLIAKGHRAIAFIGNLEFPWFVRAAQGYESAMRASGLEPRVLDFRSEDTQVGYLTAKSVFARKDRPTAVMAGNDQIAMGVYDALRELRISIPDEVSVIGMNDTQGAVLTPKLTSVRSFPEELGRHMAEFVLNRVQNPALARQELSIPTQLVQRDSVAAPARTRARR